MTRAADFVLVNTKTDKGYDLILEVAALRPDIPFVCIAAQSGAQEAVNAAVLRGLRNVRLGERADDVSLLYGGAKVVAIPGFELVEAFQLACVEASRFGKPVLGSWAGHVPVALKEHAILLPHDATAWAEELGRLFTDEAHFATRRIGPSEASPISAHRDQRAALRKLIRHVQAPVLVGVGSGIGNMIHASPTIRRLAQHLGHPVDLLVAEDHQDSLFLLHHRDYVNAVYPLRQYALDRIYDTAFITHCFGPARLPIRAKHVKWSRDWGFFHPDHPLHEALFNLEAAKQLLGIDYAPAEAADPYVGEYSYQWPGGDLVGFHGGSKEGIWVSKRWPYHKELAVVLKRKGYRVASFGTSDEYVDGTENMTGGTIRQMIERMLKCSFFVSNDSGVMNIANALGIPLLAIFGPTNVRTRGPLRPTSRTISLVKECSPCECKNSGFFLAGQCRCLGDMTLDTVEEAFARLVRETREASEAVHPSPVS